jgi:hypothetical protein
MDKEFSFIELNCLPEPKPKTMPRQVAATTLESASSRGVLYANIFQWAGELMKTGQDNIKL